MGSTLPFFNCPLTLCYLQFGIPIIYRCRLLPFFRLSVSLLSFVPTFPSLCPSFFLSFLFVSWAFPPEPSLVWYLFSFFCFFLFLFPLLFSFLYCSVFPLWTLSSGRVSICCCNLRPRNLYLFHSRKASVRNLVVLDGCQSRNIDLM